jgi:uncharacterized membrane protein YccC
MHPDRHEALRRIGQRIAGTFAGVAVAWVLVESIRAPWPLVALATASAALIPWGLARGVLTGTAAVTLFILLIFDVGLIASGGDRALLFGRLWDALLGTAAAAAASLALSAWRERRPAAG